MYCFDSRAFRATIVLAVVALSACVDDQDPIGPPDSGRQQAAAGDILTVTTTNDAGIGSLRWAMSSATGGELILFDPDLAGQTITLDSTITITKPVTIDGTNLIISGGSKVRLFRLDHTGTTTFRSLSLTGGKAPADQSGGALEGPGVVVLENMAVYGNEASRHSAIWAGNLTLINSTVSGNVSLDSYPAVHTLGGMTLNNSTIAFNTGGGISGASVTTRNSISSNNGSNCGVILNAMVFEGTNIADDDSCGGATGALIADPLLAPLADNDGSTLTHALMAGSPAIDAGTSCTEVFDQRFFLRDAECDVGAFEVTPLTGVTITIDMNARLNRVDGRAVVTGTVRCTRYFIPFDLALTLSQSKKGRTPSVVQASGTTPVVCIPSAQAWSIEVTPPVGAFEVGNLQAAVQTANTPPSVAPASAARKIKLRQ